MILYQVVLEIYDGANRYEQSQFVLAGDDRAAARLARELADQWRPNALHDHELDLYSAPEGWPQWVLAQCKRVTYLSVPVAGEKEPARVALVPWRNSFRDVLVLCAQLLGAVSDRSLSDWSIKRLTTDHLHLSERTVANALEAIVELCDHLIGTVASPDSEGEVNR